MLRISGLGGLEEYQIIDDEAVPSDGSTRQSYRRLERAINSYYQIAKVASPGVREFLRRAPNPIQLPYSVVVDGRIGEEDVKSVQAIAIDYSHRTGQLTRTLRSLRDIASQALNVAIDIESMIALIRTARANQGAASAYYGGSASPLSPLAPRGLVSTGGGTSVAPGSGFVVSASDSSMFLAPATSPMTVSPTAPRTLSPASSTFSPSLPTGPVLAPESSLAPRATLSPTFPSSPVLTPSAPTPVTSPLSRDTSIVSTGFRPAPVTSPTSRLTQPVSTGIRPSSTSIRSNTDTQTRGGLTLTGLESFCPQVFVPVLGVNGQVYANPCVAKKAGVKVSRVLPVTVLPNGQRVVRRKNGRPSSDR